MKRPLSAFALLLALAPAARGADVWFVAPDAGAPLFGHTELQAHVESDEAVASVEFFLDGRSVAVLTTAPWAVQVDVGYENQEHRLRVVATLQSGERIEALRGTGTVQVEDSLEIELRQLYVNATTAGDRIRDLDRGDFKIFDGGTQEQIVTFEHGEVPMTAVLMLDASSSMEGNRLKAAVRGARTFLAGMAPLDEAKLLLFSDRLLSATPFTRDQAVLEAALSTVEPVGGTAINDYLFAGLKLLDGRQGRRVVVLLSDGSDLHSLLSMRDVFWKAQRSQAMLYWIFLRESTDPELPDYTTAWRGHEQNREEVQLLRQAVVQSGGHITELASPNEIEGAFAEIISELREQYVLGYYPHESRHDGSWRDVDVRVRRTGAKVRTRQGYIDD
jgi:Ca-activated chloride channel homolog